MNLIDETPRPQGELALQTVAMPADTNANGDIFGGWLLSQMDIAGGVAASEVAGGRVATVAIQGMSILPWYPDMYFLRISTELCTEYGYKLLYITPAPPLRWRARREALPVVGRPLRPASRTSP